MHLVVGESDTGFVIHAAGPAAAPTSLHDHAGGDASGPAAARVAASPPQAPVTLGSSVRFDRRAFIPSKTKDISHGEDR
ncbi:MAG: hypothetical protein ACKOPQ_02785 [Novosphingobium sp.]